MTLSIAAAKDHPPLTVTQTYDVRDTILYALGLGYGADPFDPIDLAHVYERDLRAVPTMALVLAAPPLRRFDLDLNYARVVHASQSLTLDRPIPIAGSVTSVSTITEVIDRGPDKGSILTIERMLYDDATGDRLAAIEIGLACRGDGGFGGPIGVAPIMTAEPAYAPDLTAAVSTSVRSAVIYRLSGDYNPLHVDPGAARQGGFARPILHGLATFGMAARAAAAALDVPVDTLTHIEGRFSAPVYPGEALQADVWRADGAARLRLIARERGVVVFANGTANFA